MHQVKKTLQSVDWWEIGYFVVYGIIFIHEFLYTTMFDIIWPPRTGYVLIAISTLYTLAKLYWYKAYTTKEQILGILICLTFAIPGALTDYSYIYWIGFLIVGAKGIDFSKILKFYLIISITIMAVAFAASQGGIIEDLQYMNDRGAGKFLRHSFGIVYPTDYAAHLFYMTMAAMVLYDKKWNTITKIWISSLVAISVFLTSNAQTTTITLFVFVALCVLERALRTYMGYIEKVFRLVPITLAAGFIYLAYRYDANQSWMAKINSLISGRLQLSKKGLDDYPVKLFGQNVIENGLGTSTANRDFYFYLDDSYIRILLEYGIIAFIVTIIILAMISKKASEEKKYILVIVLVAIAVQSVMEQHLIDIAYNPMILALFARVSGVERKEKWIHQREC